MCEQERKLRDFCEIMLEADHGPCWFFEMHYHVPIVRQMIDELLFWRKKPVAFLTEPPNLGEYADDTCVDVAIEGPFIEFAAGQAIIGTIASLFETLIHRAMTHTCEAWGARNIPHHSNERWRLDQSQFWKPSIWVYKVANEQPKYRNDVRQGFRQLLNAIGFATAVPDPVLTVFDAVMEYRNASLHGGFEWSRERQNELRKRFGRENVKKWLFEYLEEKELNSGRKRTETWMIGVKDQFIDEALLALDSLARSLRSIVTHIKSES